MKYDLTGQDLKSIQYSRDRNPINIFFKNKDNVRFKIGDILIKSRKQYQGGWHREMISEASKVPVKYLYIYENEYGVGYIKRIKANGTETCENIICLADINLDYTKFEVDPDYLNSVILSDGNIDVGEQYNENKKRQNKLNELNRKIAIKFKTDQEWFDFFNTLKVGQEFWQGYSIRDATKSKYTVTAIRVETNTNTGYGVGKCTQVAIIEAQGDPSNDSWCRGATQFFSNGSKKSVIYIQQPHVTKEI